MTSSRIKSSLYLVFAIVLALLFSTIFFSRFTIRKVEENMAIQVHTRTVIITLKDNLTFLLNAETEERGFIITGDTGFLKSHHSEINNINATISKLKQLVTDNPVQVKNVDTLEQLIHQKISRITELILLKKQAGEKMITEMLLTSGWRYNMEQIQAVNYRMQRNEEILFKERIANTQKSIATAGNVFTAEEILSLLVIVLLGGMIVSGLKKRTIAEKKVIEYNMALETKNKEIEQFAYIASHDLQEPLRSITNFSKLLQDKLLEEGDREAKEYAGLISNATARMSNLIFDLLQYSRIGKDMDKVTIDCNSLVSAVLQDMEALIKDRGAEIHVAKLPVLKGYNFLGSVFQNLVSNGIKFSKAGVVPVIDISAADNGNEYHFFVKDNGIGIDKNYYDKIFIIFQRLHGRGEYPGTGIGLAQCKKIVALHGGKIWVESVPGKGTTFNFTISKYR